MTSLRPLQLLQLPPLPYSSSAVAICCAIVLACSLLQGSDARSIQNGNGGRARLRRDAGAIKDQRSNLQKHLHKYAYLANTEPSDDDLRKALRTYQAVAGVPVTGEADAATLAATRLKRCSRPDAEPAGLTARAKRYALPHASKWNPKHFNGHRLTLKWYISKYTNDMDKSATRKTIQKGFEIWSRQTHIPQFSHLDKNHQVTLEFAEATQESDADINIRWEEGQHGDRFPFDGDGDDNENVLAHTFYPDYKPFPLNGDIHFDDAEKWSLQVGVNTFFPYVLVHEIGHALGLQHSHSSLAIMNPHYKDIPIDSIHLHADDKCGVNWNIAGPTNWCLFVWLTSEIVPIHSQTSGVNMNKKLTKQEKIWSVKKQLWNAQLPLCSSENSVRSDLLVLLEKNLHFSVDDSILYGEICCRFLDKLDQYRMKIGEYAHKLNEDIGKTKEFVSTPEDGNKLSRRALHRFAAEKPSILDDDHFDTEFFDSFFAEY
ncbi:hypothetical protein PENTCL1PPCAC_9361 [Pristionchus entomophagus]|uniref:Peptidase metallopeptidase domain-containing protein n=1 Tax=Pristionchus entomophagus TaxID=358040 RepID=A0AAV5T666_9BILA|nr:hypothetical protein PENTCL1PPCAC_9361 [Pristionchus entomophagus]